MTTKQQFAIQTSIQAVIAVALLFIAWQLNDIRKHRYDTTDVNITNSETIPVDSHITNWDDMPDPLPVQIQPQ